MMACFHAVVRCLVAAATFCACIVPVWAQRPPEAWSPDRLHPAILPMLRGSVLMGDGRIGKLELAYLLRAVERHKGADPNLDMVLANDLWRLLTRIPSDHQAIEAFADQLKALAQAKSSLVAEVFMAAELGAEPSPAAQRVLSLSKQLEWGKLRGRAIDVEVVTAVYWAVRSDALAEDLPGLGADHPLLPVVLDAYKVNPKAKGRSTAVKLGFESKDRHNQILLAEVSAAGDPNAAANLLDKLGATLPHTTNEKGERLLVVNTGDGSAALASNIFFARNVTAMRLEFAKAANEGATLPFYIKPEASGDTAALKAWALWRLHPDDYGPVLQQARKLVATADAPYFDILLAESMRYAAVSGTRQDWYPQARKFMESATPQEVPLALAILRWLVTDADIPMLSKLASQDTANDTDTRLRARTAARAIQCLAELRTPAAMKALGAIRDDSNAPPPARDLAKQMIAPASQPATQSSSTQPVPNAAASGTAQVAVAAPPSSTPVSPTSRPAHVVAPEDRGEDFSPKPVDELLSVLGESQDIVARRKAAKVLGDRGLAGSLQLSEEQRAALERYIEESLLVDVASKDAAKRSEANAQIQRLWRPAGPVLVRNIDQKNLTVVEACSKNLILMRDEKLIVALIEKTRKSQGQGRLLGIMCLGKMTERRESQIPGRTCLAAKESLEIANRLIKPFLLEAQQAGDGETKILVQRALQELERQAPAGVWIQTTAPARPK